MKIIDAFGKACPIPVIMVKNEIESENFNHEDISIKVDNHVAVENLSKLARLYKINSSFEEIEGGYIVNIESSKFDSTKINEEIDVNQFVENAVSYLITNDKIGSGSDELGENLMQMALYALTQLETVPKTVAMMNSGVNLATVNEETIKSLKELQDKGTRVLVCGACLNYYNLTECLKVGEVSNAYEIMLSMQSGTVINL